MIRSRAALGAVLLAALSTTAVAQQPSAVEQRFSPQYAPCLERDPSTAGMRECMSAEYARQDRALNVAYQRALAQLNTRQAGKLRAAQRAWVAYRDARCASLADQDWGTLSLLAASECGVSMTVERLLDLEDYPPGG